MGARRLWTVAAALALVLTACTAPAPSASTPSPSTTDAATLPSDSPLRHTEPSAPSGQSQVRMDAATGAITDPSAAPTDDGQPSEGRQDGETPAQTGLGQGSPEPLARGAAAPGLTWADGTPVTVDVLAMAQVRSRPSPSTESLKVDSGLDAFGGGGFYTYLAGADGNRWLGLRVARDLVEGNYSSGSGSTMNIGYAEGKQWHNGPAIPFVGWISPESMTTSGGTLYYSAQLSDMMEPDEVLRWKVLAWSPGDKKPREVISEAQAAGMPQASQLAVLGDQLYFISAPDEYSFSPALYAVPTAGGKPRVVTELANNPIVGDGALYFETYDPSIYSENSVGFQESVNVTAIWKITPGRAPVKVLSISTGEVERALSSVDPNSMDGYATDEQSRPLATPGLIAAGGTTVVFRHRGQPLILDLARHTGTRVIPVVSSTSVSGWRRFTGTVCRDGVALSMSVDSFETSVLLWRPNGGTLGALDISTDASALSCSDGGIHVTRGDPAMGYANAATTYTPRRDEAGTGGR